MHMQISCDSYINYYLYQSQLSVPFSSLKMLHDEIRVTQLLYTNKGQF